MQPPFLLRGGQSCSEAVWLVSHCFHPAASPVPSWDGPSLTPASPRAEAHPSFLHTPAHYRQPRMSSISSNGHCMGCCTPHVVACVSKRCQLYPRLSLYVSPKETCSSSVNLASGVQGVLTEKGISQSSLILAQAKPVPSFLSDPMTRHSQH